MSLRSLSFVSLGLVFAPACGSDGPCDPEAPNSICTIAGSEQQGYKGDNGPATAAALYIPQDTLVAPDGTLWISDFNNYVVRTVDAEGVIRTVVGSGELGDTPADPAVPQEPAAAAKLNHTPDMLFHDGYLYLAAWHNSRVKRVRLSDMMIENYAGAGKRMYFDGDGGPALDAALDLPSSIAVDPAGNIVIMDQANQVIRRVDQDGIITTIVGRCVVELPQCTPDTELTACPGSSKFVCGTEPAQLYRVDRPAEELTCVTTACTPGYGGDGGPAIDARMGQPFGQAADPAGRLAYDTQGNLIFADTDNNRIRKVDTNGIITTIAGTGEPGYSGDDGPGTAAQLNRPIDVEIAPDGTVYFTDADNNCVRKIEPSGTIRRVAGRCGEERGFSGDGGSPLDARMDRPYGIELSGNKLYVTDSYNNRVRVVNLPE